MLLCNLQLKVNCNDDIPGIPIQDILREFLKFRFRSNT